MYFRLKKSLIKNWWVADENNKMGFVNILRKENIKGKLLVVGYYGDVGNKELATSTNGVVKITKEGVITAKGSFYPFEEANAVYMQYLIEANTGNSIIANWWEWIGKNKIRANLVNENKLKVDLEIDFTPIHNTTGVFVSGYSEQLKANVVISPFREGNYCLMLKIPQYIKRKIYAGALASNEEIICRVSIVKKIYEKNM